MYRGYGEYGVRGAMTLEYVFSMALACIFTMGVFGLFRALAIQVINGFISWVAVPWP
jgi:hypothetical protein